RRGTELTAVAGEVAGHAMQVIPVSLAVLPEGGTGSLYEDLSDNDLETVETRLVPYFAWGNRGASEMSVWLPVVW
ncbi:MAG: glycoside hydrolase family 127 protein, partial [Humibacter sp.]